MPGFVNSGCKKEKLIVMMYVVLQTVDKAVCTEESGAARLEAVLVALVERKARALHAEHARRRARTHPLLLLFRDHLPDGQYHTLYSIQHLDMIRK